MTVLAPPPTTPRDDDRPTLLMIGRGEPLDAAIAQALDRHGLLVETTDVQHAADAVRVSAPELVLLVGDAAADDGRAVMSVLAQSRVTAVARVALLTSEADLAHRLAAARLGAVAIVERTASADQIATRVAELAREAPEKAGEVLGEASFDELVAAISRELRSGILSVRAPGMEDGDGLRLVLGAGKPVAEAVQELVAKLQPLVSTAEPVKYALYDTNGELDLRDSDPGSAPDLASLAGLRVLLVMDDPVRSDGVTQELRGRGATVGICDAEGRGLERARVLDPEVVVLDAATVDGPGFQVVRAIRRDPRLRWASMLVVSWEELWPVGAAGPDIERLAQRIAPLVEPDRAIAARAKTEEWFDTRLEVIGPARLLRALARVEQTLHVTVRNPRAVVEIDLSAGLVVGASGSRSGGGRQGLEGFAALAALLALGSGRVRIERRGNPSVANVMTPVEQALAAAAEEKPPIVPSVLPPSLMGSVGGSSDAPPPSSVPRASSPGFTESEARGQTDSMLPPIDSEPSGVSLEAARHEARLAAPAPSTSDDRWSTRPPAFPDEESKTTTYDPPTTERLKPAAAPAAGKPAPKRAATMMGLAPPKPVTPVDVPAPAAKAAEKKVVSPHAKTMMGAAAAPPSPPAAPPEKKVASPFAKTMMGAAPTTPGAAAPPPPPPEEKKVASPFAKTMMGAAPSTPGAPPEDKRAAFAKTMMAPPAAPPATSTPTDTRSPIAPPPAPPADVKVASPFAKTMLGAATAPPEKKPLTPPTKPAPSRAKTMMGMAAAPALPPAQVAPPAQAPVVAVLPGPIPVAVPPEPLSPPPALEAPPLPLPMAPERRDPTLDGVGPSAAVSAPPLPAAAFDAIVSDAAAGLGMPPSVPPSAPLELAGSVPFAAPLQEAFAPPPVELDSPFSIADPLATPPPAPLPVAPVLVPVEPTRGTSRRGVFVALGLVALLVVGGTVAAAVGAYVTQRQTTRPVALPPGLTPPPIAPPIIAPPPVLPPPLVPPPVAHPAVADAGSVELRADLGPPVLGAPDLEPPDLGPPDLGPPDLGPAQPTITPPPTEPPVVVVPEPTTPEPTPPESPSDDADSSDALAARASRLAQSAPGEAQRLVDRALRLDPQNPRAMAAQAEIALARGEPGNGLSWALRAQRLRPRRSAYAVLVGDAYFALGRRNEAQTQWRQALELDPNDREARRRLGRR